MRQQKVTADFLSVTIQLISESWKMRTFSEQITQKTNITESIQSELRVSIDFCWISIRANFNVVLKIPGSTKLS